MKDLRGSELPINTMGGLEKEVWSIKHSQFWRDLEAELDRIVNNAQNAVLTNPTVTLQEIQHLQGIYLIAKKVKGWPEKYIDINQKEKETEQ